MSILPAQLLQRIAEFLVGSLGLVVAALTLWMCYGAMVQPPDANAAETPWTLTVFLTLIALAVALFSLRLIIPRLRIEGGHIISVQALAAFLFLYVLGIIATLISGSRNVAGLFPVIAVVFSVVVLIRQRLGARRDL
jgi:drug/metabolite transporter (DMT)-like permease